MSGFNRLIKNSLANIINGFSNVILGVAISPFLISILSLDEFSVWSICLQAGIAVSIFGVAGQITIGRFTSLAKFKGNDKEFNRTINNYLNIILYISIVFLLLIALIAFNFDVAFPHVPKTLIFDSIIAFLLISGSFVIGVYSTIFVGYFIGIEKNYVTANINLISRVGIGIGVVFAARYGIIAMALVYFLINILSYIAMYFQFRKFELHRFSIGFEGKLDELFKFFGGLTIWNVAQFLISGIGIFVVSIYDYANLAYFVLAMTMVNAIVGLLGAIVNPIIQPIVKLNEGGNGLGVDKLVIALSMIFSLVIFLGVIISNHISIYILEMWAGNEKGAVINGYFNLLLVAYSIRMVVAPYGMLLVAKGQQLRIAHYPILEGLLNLLLSLYFVDKFGAIGISYATIFSALVIMFFYAVRYRRESLVNVKNLSVYFSFIFIPILSVASVFGYIYFSSDIPLIVNFILVIIIAIFISSVFSNTLKVKNIVNGSDPIVYSNKQS